MCDRKNIPVAAQAQPVAFAKDGVLFWHGEHAAWRGFNGDLYLTAQAQPCVPDVLFDGYAVLSALDDKARSRTSPENVSDVLDAVVRLVRATPPADGQTQPPSVQDREDAEPNEWMTDESRAPWAINSLKARIKEMRASEKRCRNAFRKDYMRVVSVYFADALGEAAGAFEKRLAAIDAARAAKEE